MRDDGVHDSDTDGDGSLDQDRDILLDEEEREKLLSESMLSSKGRNRTRKTGKLKNIDSNDSRDAQVSRDIFFKPSEANDEYKGTTVLSKPRAPTLRKIAVVSAVLLTVLILLIYSSLELSLQTDSRIHGKTLYSNGSHPFYPTTIMVSLDGFRPDFLNQNLTPYMHSFQISGVSAKYMKPAFPSVTFPNHWTLVTGLFPESHGIVGNTFWDPKQRREFYYTDPKRSLQPEWWGGEPIWSTAERQGVKTAVHMWPGSELVEGQIQFPPSYVDRFKKRERLSDKVTRILGWLDLDMKERPQLILSYVPDVDVIGHKFGPNTTEIDEVVKQVDSMIGSLLRGLDERNLTDIVNVIVVSDHGMATTDKTRLIHLRDILPDRSRVEHMDGWPLYGLRPKKGVTVEELHADLLKSHQEQPFVDSPFHDQPIKPWSLYLRDVDMPSRWHFSKNERIAPLWLVPEAGWAIVTEKDFLTDGKDYEPRGLHGYDNEHPLMRSIFIARGPLFRSNNFHGHGRAWKRFDGSLQQDEEVMGSLVEPFTNTEVFGIICESLGLAAPSHNGTLSGVAGFRKISPEKLQTGSTSTSTNTATSSKPENGSANIQQSAVPTANLNETNTPENEHEDSRKLTSTGRLGQWWEKVKDKAHDVAVKFEHWWQRVWVEG